MPRQPTQVLGEGSGTTEEAGLEGLATHEDAAAAYMAHAAQGFSEQAERMLEAAVVVLVGGMLVYADHSWAAVAFVAATLLVARPLAVLLTYGGRGAKPELRPYVAWFGIRGIGSLYYLFYAMGHGVEGDLARRLLGVTLAVVAVSVVVHGISVTPLIAHYGRMRGRKRRDASV